MTSNAQRYQQLRANPWASALYAAYLAELQQQLQAAGLRTLQKYVSGLLRAEHEMLLMCHAISHSCHTPTIEK